MPIRGADWDRLRENRLMKLWRGQWAPGIFFGAMVALRILIAGPAAAGQDELSLQSQQSDQKPAPAATPAAAPAAGQEASKTDEQKKTDPNAKPDAAGTSKDRLFYAMPNFLTLESTEHVPPLTSGQKFKVVARGSFDPFQFFWYGLLSGINEANGSEPGYGNGFQGYAKRYGASFADGTIENFMTGAVMASLLHQDPRFYTKTEGGFMHRVGYAVSRIFITRGDSGRTEFNASEIVGSALSAGISTYSYHPHADKTLDNTLSVWGTQVGYDAITTVIKEFWPDLRKKFGKKTKTDGDLE
jgi:hypothetical protein